MTVQAHHTASIKSRLKSRGFTLAEALIASVFLAITVLGVADALTAAARQVQQLNDSSMAQGLAKELIEEISSKCFTVQPTGGWSSGQHDRSKYDDAADYDGYTDGTAAGIKTLQGTTLNFGDGSTYTRTVSFDYRTTPGGVKAASGDFGMVTVTVTTASGASVKLQRLRSNPVVKR